jgi:hypothetical protein
MQTVFSFFRLTLLGMGLQKTKIKMNTKWLSLAAIAPALIMMKHVSFSPNLYTTSVTVLHVMFLVTFKREGHPVWTNWPTCLQVDLQKKKKTQRRYAKISTNRKLLTYVDCRVPRI